MELGSTANPREWGPGWNPLIEEGRGLGHNHTQNRAQGVRTKVSPSGDGRDRARRSLRGALELDTPALACTDIQTLEDGTHQRRHAINTRPHQTSHDSEGRSERIDGLVFEWKWEQRTALNLFPEEPPLCSSAQSEKRANSGCRRRGAARERVMRGG